MPSIDTTPPPKCKSGVRQPGNGSDSEILAAYRDFLGLQGEMARGGQLPNAEFTALSHRSDAACDAALAIEPETVLEMAIQVHVAFHLAFGGTYVDVTAVALPEPGKDEEVDFLRPIYDRAFRLTAGLRMAGDEA